MDRQVADEISRMHVKAAFPIKRKNFKKRIPTGRYSDLQQSYELLDRKNASLAMENLILKNENKNLSRRLKFLEAGK